MSDMSGKERKLILKTKTISQIIIFRAAPNEVYAALMDSKKHSKFTGSRAKISGKVGGKIEAYDGYIQGKNISLEKNKRIVQSWRACNWPKGHYSTATFKLKRISSGTKLVFTQTGVPIEFYKPISDGWKEHYWEPIKKLLKLNPNNF